MKQRTLAREVSTEGAALHTGEKVTLRLKPAPGGKVDVLWVDERPLSVDLPSTVSLKVVESADGVKGDTASNVQKPAKLETGLVVQVPLFIKEGEVIRVSTVDGTYLGRV